ncbi:hypothetical protein D7316_03241 [Gordonia insulae]|uniref:DUF3263 domain-containing protein n=1 Tax=Gordonia insulae TaxID=2420509 RepID=A0A3G8JR37_9ACTN|nr:hypothetical protein D7316_03241 [Gordonia insulae]
MIGPNMLYPNISESDRSMIRYLLRWAPFDGGDDEIFPTFGISPGTFYLRVGRLLQAEPDRIPHHNLAELIAYCARKARATSTGR